MSVEKGEEGTEPRKWREKDVSLIHHAAGENNYYSATCIREVACSYLQHRHNGLGVLIIRGKEREINDRSVQEP